MSYNTILATAPLTTQNYHLKMIGTSIGNSLIWDNGTNVGIGNTNTSYTLDVSGTGRFTGMITSTVGNNAKIFDSASATTGYQYFQMSNSVGTMVLGVDNNAGTGLAINSLANAVVLNNSANAPLILGTNNTNRMTITSAGNVGIGTSSPSSKLEVSGTIRSTTQTDPTSGTGIELFYRGADSASYIQSYDRTNSAWKDIRMFGNNLIFGTSDTERMRITSAGNVGIGVTPNTWFTSGGYKVLQIGAGMSLDSGNDFRARIASNAYVNTSGNWVYSNTGFATNYSQTSGQHIWQTAPSGTSGNAITFTDRMTITSGGNVGIGITPLSKFFVNIASGQNIRFSQEGGQASISAVNDAANAFAMLNIDGNVVRIQSNNTGGNVCIGTATDFGYKLNLNGQPGANGYTAWTNWSDIRLKENVTDLEVTNVLEKICEIRPVTYNYNELSGFDEATRSRRISGFIAQELMEIFPDMVGTIKKDNVEYHDTNLSNLNLYLVKAIQEQQIQIQNLQEQINILAK